MSYIDSLLTNKLYKVACFNHMNLTERSHNYHEETLTRHADIVLLHLRPPLLA